MSNERDDELVVRVSGTGAWRPSTALASVGEAAGSWRVAPEIDSMMVLTREAGPTTTKAARRVLLAGMLSAGGSLADILTLIHMAAMDGALFVTATGGGGDVTKVLYFRRGVYLAGRSSLTEDRLGSVLVREGLLTAAQRDHCMSKVAEGMRLGTVLVAEKLMTTPQVYEGLRHQGEQIFYSTLGVTTGFFRLVVPLDMSQVPAMLRLSVQSLLLEGMRRLDEAAHAQSQQTELHRPEPVSDAELPDNAATRIIAAYNDALARLFAVVPAADRGHLLSELRHFVVECVPYRELFANVAVADDGTLDAAQLRRNDEALGEGRLRTLQEGLNELFFFIMFAADDVVDDKVEAQLQHDVARALSRLPGPQRS